MQNGQVGVLIVIIAVVISTAGGYLFNAKDTTACGTNFNYVTDIAGAFEGTGGDIAIDHTPLENINGYSVFNPTNQAQWNSSTVSGIDYLKTSSNGYWVYKQTGEPVSQTLTISHNRATNNGNDGTITYDFGEGTPSTSTINGDWGLNNAEIRTVIFVDGTTHTRVAGTTVTSLIKAYTDWAGANSLNNISSVRIYFDSSTDGYPGFVSDMSFNVYRSSSGGYYGINNEVTYSNIQNDIVVNPMTGSVSMANSTYSWNNVYLVWGDSNVTSANLTMIIGGTVVTEYIDPLNGVRPISMAVSDPTQQGELTNSTHISGSFQVPASGERAFRVSAVYKSDEGVPYNTLFTIEIVHASNGYYDVSNSSPYTTLYSGNLTSDLYVYWDWNQSSSNIVSIWVSNSTMPDNAKTVPTIDIPPNGTYSVGMRFTILGDTMNNVVSIINNNSATPVESTTNTGGGNFNFVTQYALPLEVTYTTTYWSNGGENSSLSMIFKKPTGDIDNTYNFTYVLKDGTSVTESVRLGYSDNHWYFYNESNTAVNLGNWQGLKLTIGIQNNKHYYTLTPIDRFNNFQDYSTVNYTYTYESSITAPDTSKMYRSLKYIQFNNTDQPYLWHQIQDTTIFLSAGGIYLTDGRFSPSTSFPSDQIIQFRIMGSPHAGESVSLILPSLDPDNPSEVRTYTYSVNELGTGLIIDDKSYEFNEIGFYYVDADTPSVTIAGKTYSGGLYINGQILEKGHIYLQTGKNGEFVDMGETDNTWVIQLNGMWAFSSAYYTGENIATTVLEWDEPGVWHWDKTLTIIVFIGATILSVICCSRIWDMGWLDWAISICACVIAFMLLG